MTTPTTPNAATDWNRIGAPDCNVNSHNAVKRASGFVDAQGRETPGASPNYSAIAAQIPQLLVRDAQGRRGWNPLINRVTIEEKNGVECVKSETPDATYSTIEVDAAIIAVAQRARADVLAQASANEIQSWTGRNRQINIPNERMEAALPGVSISEVREAIRPIISKLLEQQCMPDAGPLPTPRGGLLGAISRPTPPR